MSAIVETLHFGQRSLTIERPADAEVLIDDDRFAADEFLPYWAELWPSGVALAEHLAGLALGGKRVLELGCGIGLPSLLAAASGAVVTATDWAPEALACIAANASRNGLALTIEAVDWFAPPRTHSARFDLVLAADVLYEERNVEPVLRLIGASLGPDGHALVSDPGRRHAAPFPAASRRHDLRPELLPAPRLPAGGIWRLWRTASTLGASGAKSLRFVADT